jgi:hypothetical protein
MLVALRLSLPRRRSRSTPPAAIHPLDLQCERQLKSAKPACRPPVRPAPRSAHDHPESEGYPAMWPARAFNTRGLIQTISFHGWMGSQEREVWGLKGGGYWLRLGIRRTGWIKH